MPPPRVHAFIDGFNLYHAMVETGLNYLKWCNLWALCKEFARPPELDLQKVFFFTAYAYWRQDSFARHREYVKALESTGVTPIMGKFKDKPRSCKLCHRQWLAHEEKETDVNIAIHLVAGAFRNEYDRALIVSNDSDLAPAVRMVRRYFPEKRIKLIAPIGRDHSGDLIHAVGGRRNCSRMKEIHLTRALLPRKVLSREGAVVAVRPPAYTPPEDIRPA